MKLLLFASCLIGILFLSQHARSQPAPKNLDSLINALGSNFINEPFATGLAIGIYNNGTESYYNFGTTERGNQTLPTNHTIFELGSITKTFVSLVLAHTVLEGKVKLTDDIRLYLQEAYPNLELKKQPIRLEHLANTTSGIPNWLPDTPDRIKKASPDSTAFLREQLYGSFTKQDFFKALHEVKLDTVPGFKTRHSNAAAQLLCYILEKVHNTTIDSLVKKYVLIPNGMQETGFLTSLKGAAGLAHGYSGNGLNMPYFTTTYLKGVGGLNSTTSDAVKFIKLQLSKNNAAVKLTHQQSFNAGYYSIGLNWLTYKHDNGLHQVWTDGGTYGFVSYLVFYPELNSGLVLLANSSDDNIPGRLGDIAYKIFLAIQ